MASLSKSVLLGFTFLGINTIVFHACTDSNTDSKVSAPIEFVNKDTVSNIDSSSSPIKNEPLPVSLSIGAEEKLILSLPYKIKPGHSYNQVKEIFPLVKGIRPEEAKDELANSGYTESITKTTFAGRNISLEFNFKNDSLYSMYLQVVETNPSKAELFFNDIKNYYTNLWGEPSHDAIEEENHYLQSYIWPEKNVNNVYPFVTFGQNRGIIIWGLKNGNPL